MRKLSWQEYTDNFDSWSESTRRSYVSRLENFGHHQDVAWIASYLYDETSGSKLINMAIDTGIRCQSQKKVVRGRLFKKKTIVKTYDKDNKKPVIKASICNGEQVAGFKDIHTGKIEEVMLIKSPSDIDIFKKMYGIDEEIAKEY